MSDIELDATCYHAGALGKVGDEKQDKKTTATNIDVYNGNFSGSSQTINTLKVYNGDVELVNCTVGKDVDKPHYKKNTVHANNGRVRIVNNTRVYGSVEVNNGSLTISSGSQIYGAIKNNNGNIIMKEARVEGDVTILNGTVKIENANIGGTLTANTNAVTVGVNSSIAHLHMNERITIDNATTSFSNITLTGVSGISINMINGSPLIGHEGVSTLGVYSSHETGRKNSAEREKRSQKVILMPGSTLKQLSFSGKKCVLTLFNDASYHGKRDITGLEIINKTTQ